jgi:hypothetical protein
MSRALEHYRRAMKAQRDGNWGLDGHEIQATREVPERRKNPSRSRSPHGAAIGCRLAMICSSRVWISHCGNHRPRTMTPACR